MQTRIARRTFLRQAAIGGSGLLILKNARLAWAYEANSKLNLAGIGVGGQGRGNLDQFAGLGQNIVALCDVDRQRAGDIYQKHPSAKVFADFHRMFDVMEREIDAVVVSTPDHTHAVAAVAAMQRGKHVYCEKPLTRTVREARVLRETALATKVVTQMGNQGSAEPRLRRAIELIQGGVLGEVREAHVWFDGGNEPHTRPSEQPPVPSTLDWDLWLGPAEPRQFHPAYLPATWRGWRAFGSGIVGDFGCHTGNIMFRALRLDDFWKPRSSPDSKSVIRFQAWPSEVSPEGYPSSMRAVFEFPARGDSPPAKVTLYAKERPAETLMLGYPQSGWGDLMVGSRGSLYSDCPWNTRFVLLPEERFDGFKGGPPESLPRSPGHHREWVEACQGHGRTFSPFEIGGPLTEFLQLANLATLVEGPLEYDIAAGRILNSDRAEALLHRGYRAGWSLESAKG
jgi:predicted dehydrogenase